MVCCQLFTTWNPLSGTPEFHGLLPSQILGCTIKVSGFYFGRQMVFLHGHPGNLRVHCWFDSVVVSHGDSFYAKRYSNTGRSVLCSQFNVQYSLSTSNQSSSRTPNKKTAAYMQILIHALNSSPEVSEVGSRPWRLRQKRS